MASLLEKTINTKIGQIRQNKGITLKVLAERTGLTEGYLSRIERSDTAPPIVTLMRIAEALSTDISFFFIQETDESSLNPPIVIDRKSAEWNCSSNLLNEANVCRYNYIALSKMKLSKNMLPYILEYDSEANESSKHDGEEFVHVLEGTLEILYGSELYVLEAGDSAYFECYIPHLVKSRGNKKAKILNVIFPYTKRELDNGT